MFLVIKAPKCKKNRSPRNNLGELFRLSKVKKIENGRVFDKTREGF